MTRRFDDTYRVYEGSVVQRPRAGRSPIPDLSAIARDMWPDLRRPAQIVLLPREDFEVLVASLAGRPALAVRTCLCVKVGTAPSAKSMPKARSWPTRAAEIISWTAIELLLLGWAYAMGRGWV